MREKVHLLVTVRKPELLEAAGLVFRTLRTGFPHADVYVWGNGLDEASASRAKCWVVGVGGSFRNLPDTSHDAWIESLVQRSAGPFWICDGDVVFFGAMKRPRAGAVLAGRLEPEFDEEWTRTRHVERLHTAVMWLDPVAVRGAIRAEMAKVPVPWRHSAEFPLIRQTFIPVRGGQTIFYDSTAGLWQAGVGTPFEREPNEAFEHLHCGSTSDLVSRAAPGLVNLAAIHRRVLADPDAARGLREEQAGYYERRACITRG